MAESNFRSPPEVRNCEGRRGRRGRRLNQERRAEEDEAEQQIIKPRDEGRIKSPDSKTLLKCVFMRKERTFPLSPQV